MSSAISKGSVTVLGVTLLLFTFFYFYGYNLIKVEVSTKMMFSMTWNTSDVVGKVLASTGRKFYGKPFRKYTGKPFRMLQRKVELLKLSTLGLCTNRRKWAVITTVSEPSEAVRRFLYKKDWCLVIVGDETKPEQYRIATSFPGNNLVFLSASDQKAIGSAFVDAQPWRSFGRKNVGYLVAIANGAKVIWDFDDDNMLKFWMKGASTDDTLEIDTFARRWGQLKVREPNVTTSLLNPYMVMGIPNGQLAWPRGLPLSAILDPAVYDIKNFTEKDIDQANIGVLQSLADHNPDMDAIFRLTAKEATTLSFARPVLKDQHRALLLPHGVFTPFNAQATLHLLPAFFALYLPVTVAGRVSDIWRSYVAKALFDAAGVHVAFLPRPLVVQLRNQHPFEADFEAEQQLYAQAAALIKFLKKWTNEKVEDTKLHGVNTDLIHDLWVQLFERGYIEKDDVHNVDLWLQALFDVGGLGRVTVNHVEERGGITTYNFTMGQRVTYDFGLNAALPAACSNLPKKTFWTSDWHHGTRIDMPSVLATLGQRVIFTGVFTEGPHPYVFKTLGINVYTRVSELVKKQFRGHGYNYNPLPEELEEHVKFYAGDSMVNETDVFICSFPVSMCEIWMPLNKSIAFLTAHRYNLGRCDVSHWQRLTDRVKQMNMNPHHLVGGMSRYDMEYLHHYTGNEIKIVPSYSAAYTYVGGPYNVTRQGALLFPRYRKITQRFWDAINNPLPKGVINSWVLYPYYKLSDLTQHKAIIMLPYSVMSYKLTEYYSLCVPLFIPSIRYLRDHQGLGEDRAVVSPFYCGMDAKIDLDMKAHNRSKHPYSPNRVYSLDPESEMYWLQLADFYDWPHIQYFDSPEDLTHKLATVNLEAISEAMRREMQIRKMQLFTPLCDYIRHL